MKNKRFYFSNKKVFLLLASCLSSFVYAQSTIDLADKPLYAMQVNAKPTLTLALSVEHPTVGAQYRAAYSQDTEYIGYYNQNLCYDYYSNAGNSGERYFRPNAQPSVNHGCAGRGFSGNFLNWSTGSAIDILRYSLTGGDRVLDTASVTVLQRAVIPSNFYNNGANFPLKTITAAQAQQAVPDSLRYTPGSNALYNGTVYIYNCVNQVYFRTTSGGSCGAGTSAQRLGSRISPDTFFYTRVEVCNKSGGVLQDVRKVGADGGDLCALYPNGNYKPTGKLQAYADDMRVAAFGYPLISNDSLYAGVLRAPMKYVGPNNFDNNYELIGSNPRREWDTQTGVFVQNPEGTGVAPTYVSGVINYVNQFGRTGTPGNYKGYDHVNQLYYEALRYIQGLKPSSEAIASNVVNNNTLDGFPIYTTWSDPHPPVTKLGDTEDYSCYRNHILTIGDKNTHTDNKVPGYGRTPLNDSWNEPNFNYWTSITGGFEAGVNRTYVDGEGVSRNTLGNPNPYGTMSNMASRPTGAGNKSNYSLVGMAYWAHTHDIRGRNWTNFNHATRTGTVNPVRPGMRVTSYFIDVNEGEGSNTVDQRRSNNQYMYAAKYGNFDSVRSLGGNPFTTDGVSWTNALWQREPMAELFPKGYFLASDAQAVLSALDNIFETIVNSSFNLAGASSSSGYTDSAKVGEVVYQASFDGSTWKGDIGASRISLNGAGKLEFTPIANWSVADMLDSLDEAGWKARNIIVGQRYGLGLSRAVSFNWPNLTSDQRADLMAGENANIAKARMDFLRGDRSLEGTSLRLRGSRMGDVINSGTAYKGKPVAVNYDAQYRGFYEEHKDRVGVVYVGANDGMLHAFSADTAKELFAYIPSFVVKDLYLLTQGTYSHHAYVDATPVVAEAKVAGSWKTVLAGGAGAGGQGVYALDVTSPERFSQSSLLWEFTDKDDADLGNVMGKVQIVRIGFQSTPTGAVQYKWYALVPGGVNNQVADGAVSSSGNSALFILDLSKPANEPWALGTNYYKVVLPAVAGRLRGVLNIKVVSDSRSSVKTIYAGDLSGQLWRIDLGKNRSTWNSSSAFKLFEAPAGQAISMPVSVATDMIRTYVAFGTGKYLEEADNKAPYQEQALYVIWDAGERVMLSHLAKANARSNKTIEVADFVWAPPSEATTAGVRSGWYLDLPGSNVTGERMVYSMTIRNGMIVANSLLPVGGGCSVGSSRQYVINLLKGDGFLKEVPDQMLGETFLVDTGSYTMIDPNTGNTIVVNESSLGDIGTQGPSHSGGDPLSSTSVKQLLDWRELNNYRAVKESTF